MGGLCFSLLRFAVHDTRSMPWLRLFLRRNKRSVSYDDDDDDDGDDDGDGDGDGDDDDDGDDEE